MARMLNFLLDLAKGVTNINITGTKRERERRTRKSAVPYCWMKVVVLVTLQLC